MQYVDEIIKRIQSNAKEHETVKIIVKHLAVKYHARVVPYSKGGNNFLILSSDKFDIAITVCDTDKHKVIKIEDFIVKENYRLKGIGTELMKDIIKISKENNCIVGLWCDKNNLLGQKFYVKLGFNHVDTRNDYWYEC